MLLGRPLDFESVPSRSLVVLLDHVLNQRSQVPNILKFRVSSVSGRTDHDAAIAQEALKVRVV